jgi:hypothetical protein
MDGPTRNGKRMGKVTEICVSARAGQRLMADCSRQLRRCFIALWPGG